MPADDSWEPAEAFVSSVPLRGWATLDGSTSKSVGRTGTEDGNHSDGGDASESETSSGHGSGSDGETPGDEPYSTRTVMESLEAITVRDVQARLLRRSVAEQLAATMVVAEGAECPPLDWLPLIRNTCIGLFVRLKVPSNYHLAQIVDVVDLPDMPYTISGRQTGVHLVLAYELQRRTACLTFLADGDVVRPAEFEAWMDKVRDRELASAVPILSNQVQQLNNLMQLASV